MIEKIPKAQIDSWRAELSVWKQAAVFRERVDEILHSIPRSTFFQQAGLGFLRDAWVASRVGTALSSEIIRLIPAERPDFEIQTSGILQQFEATEADMDDRRRGDEQFSSELEFDPVEQWRARFEAIPAAVTRVVTNKIAKHYSAGTGLVLYVNLVCYGAYVDEGLPILRRCTAPAKDKFKVVLVMWEGTIYKFWEDGEPVLAKWQYVGVDDF